MFDKELYQQVLGFLVPWGAAEVKLDGEARQIHVHVEHADGSLRQPPTLNLLTAWCKKLKSVTTGRRFIQIL